MNDDLIRRKEVIAEIEFGITYAKTLNKETAEVTELFKQSNVELRKAIERIKQLPSAEKHGKWIPHEDEDGEHYGDKCSECGEWYVMPYGKTNFCPNCGAKMKRRFNQQTGSDRSVVRTVQR